MPTCFTPTNDGSLVGLGTDYPFGFSIDALMDFYWRRNWHTAYIQSDISASVVAGSNSDSISSINESIAGLYFPAVSTCHDLVCGSSIYLQYVPGDPLRLSVDFSLFSGLGRIYNGLYYPYCTFNMQVQLSAFSFVPSGESGVQLYCSSAWNQEYINNQLLNSGFFQKNINLYIDLPVAPSGGLQVLGYASVTQDGDSSASLSISEVTFSTDSHWDYLT
jgi:hypothetical protein